MPSTDHNSDKFQSGSWAFSLEHREPVRVLESQTVWNHTTYLVWRPAGEQVAWVAAATLVPLEQTDESAQALDGLL